MVKTPVKIILSFICLSVVVFNLTDLIVGLIWPNELQYFSAGRSNQLDVTTYTDVKMGGGCRIVMLHEDSMKVDTCYRIRHNILPGADWMYVDSLLLVKKRFSSNGAPVRMDTVVINKKSGLPKKVLSDSPGVVDTFDFVRKAFLPHGHSVDTNTYIFWKNKEPLSVDTFFLVKKDTLSGESAVETAMFPKGKMEVLAFYDTVYKIIEPVGPIITEYTVDSTFSGGETYLGIAIDISESGAKKRFIDIATYSRMKIGCHFSYDRKCHQSRKYTDDSVLVKLILKDTETRKHQDTPYPVEWQMRKLGCRTINHEFKMSDFKPDRTLRSIPTGYKREQNVNRSRIIGCSFEIKTEPPDTGSVVIYSITFSDPFLFGVIPLRWAGRILYVLLLAVLLYVHKRNFGELGKNVDKGEKKNRMPGLLAAENVVCKPVPITVEQFKPHRKPKPWLPRAKEHFDENPFLSNRDVITFLEPDYKVKDWNFSKEFKENTGCRPSQYRAFAYLQYLLKRKPDLDMSTLCEDINNDLEFNEDRTIKSVSELNEIVVKIKGITLECLKKVLGVKCELDRDPFVSEEMLIDMVNFERVFRMKTNEYRIVAVVKQLLRKDPLGSDDELINQLKGEPGLGGENPVTIEPLQKMFLKTECMTIDKYRICHLIKKYEREEPGATFADISSYLGKKGPAGGMVYEECDIKRIKKYLDLVF